VAHQDVVLKRSQIGEGEVTRLVNIEMVFGHACGGKVRSVLGCQVYYENAKKSARSFFSGVWYRIEMPGVLLQNDGSRIAPLDCIGGRDCCGLCWYRSMTELAQPTVECFATC
jgi:hypothetical protein